MTKGTETGLTKQELITVLTKSVHAGGATKRKKGEKLPKLTNEQKDAKLVERLMQYVPVGKQAVKEDEHFFTRLVAWNHQKGAVRDAQVALPVIGLHATDHELLESNLAHLADLRPREFKRAVMLAKTLGVKRNVVRRLVARWLHDGEKSPGWSKTLSLHGKTIKWLYGRYHVKPSLAVDGELFKGLYVPGSRRDIISKLGTFTGDQIAVAVRNLKLSWLTVQGALGPKLKDPDVLAAVIGTMTSTELVTNMTKLETLGVKDHAITRAALDKALEGAATKKGSSKNTLKTTKAAEAVQDEALAGKLKALQEKQLDTIQGIEGDWAVFVDKSFSMQMGIEKGKEVAAHLVRLVRGKVIMLFFNNSVTPYDVTGKTLEEIKTLTRHEKATGGTCAYACIDWLAARKEQVGGFVVVGDGGENHPGYFKASYDKYAKMVEYEPTVYFYKVPGQDPDRLSQQVPDTQVFDLTGGVDSYSIPNLVQTMRSNRFSLTDEILATPLRTLDEVLDLTKGVEVIGKRVVTYA